MTHFSISIIINSKLNGRSGGIYDPCPRQVRYRAALYARRTVLAVPIYWQADLSLFRCQANGGEFVLVGHGRQTIGRAAVWSAPPLARQSTGSFGARAYIVGTVVFDNFCTPFIVNPSSCNRHWMPDLAHLRGGKTADRHGTRFNGCMISNLVSQKRRTCVSTFREPATSLILRKALSDFSSDI